MVRLDLFSDKLFENIFNYAKGGVAIVGMQGEWIKVNESIVNHLGYPKEELYKKKFHDITHKDDLNKDLNLMHSLIRGEIPSYEIEKRYFHKNGSIFWGLLSVSLVRDSKGEPEYFISQIHDISEQKKDRIELNQLLAVTKEQNNRLSSFADIITHNLRTHSSNLMTLLGFIEEENSLNTLDGENFKYLKESIINLTETVAHLSKIALTKTINIEQVKPLNLYNYVNQAIYNVGGLAKRINCNIVNDVDKKHFLMALPAYLDSIILNFLTNAIKYKSDKRNPEVKLTSKIQDNYLVLNIADNGLGIDLEKYGDKLFEMYSTFHLNKDAIGIGLFITKNQIETLGGKVEVQSQVDVGTEFSVFFKKA